MSKILLAAAERRFALQTRILETALVWDDPVQLWKEIEPQATANDTDQKEPYFNTLIPWQLSFDLRRAGHNEEADKINKAAGSNVPPPAAVLELLAQKAPESDVNELARAMQSFPGGERADRERATLAGSSYLLHAGKVSDAFVFVRLFEDSLLKEEALQWTARARMPAQLHAADERHSARRQLHPDRVSLGIPGISAGPARSRDRTGCRHAGRCRRQNSRRRDQTRTVNGGSVRYTYSEACLNSPSTCHDGPPYAAWRNVTDTRTVFASWPHCGPRTGGCSLFRDPCCLGKYGDRGKRRTAESRRR